MSNYSNPALIAVFLFLAACTNPSIPRVLLRLRTEPSGNNCATGGTRIESGSDSNANGVLDDSEATESQFVCNGSAGPSGSPGPIGLEGERAPRVLVSLVPEAAGTNCVHGGQRVLAGADLNDNAVLDPGEVSVTSYVCDGAPGPGITWVSVSAPVQAAPNTGYLASNSNTRVVITLPATPNPGDIVQVTGVGAGGWSIAQNSGQTIDARNLGLAPGTAWKLRHTSQFSLSAVTSSSDGRKLAAIGDEGVLTSSDRGLTWTATGATSGLPSDLGTNEKLIVSSADGSKLVASVPELRQIWLSANGGITWTMPPAASGLPPVISFFSIASSRDGTALLAGAGFGGLWTSDNGGMSWTERTAGLPAASSTVWRAAAAAADGTKLLASTSTGMLYVSSDRGATWGPPPSSPTAELWRAIRTSADGQKLAIVSAGPSGRVWSSTNGGQSWLMRDRPRGAVAMASSADGQRLVSASGVADQIYVSGDNGLSWTAQGPSKVWQSVDSSADGTRLVAVAGREIYTSALETTSGITGGLNGGQGDSVQLQYVGNGTFIVMIASGSMFGLD